VLLRIETSLAGHVGVNRLDGFSAKSVPPSQMFSFLAKNEGIAIRPHQTSLRHDCIRPPSAKKIADTHHNMLPTPDTSHVSYNRVYEPAEDSFLLLDVLSSPAEKVFLTRRFPPSSPPPLVLEVGTGSGVVIAFLTAQAQPIFGRQDVLSAGVDVNRFACADTAETVRRSVQQPSGRVEQVGDSGGSVASHGQFLGAFLGDLVSPWRADQVDVLVFNPPYVPTEELPDPPEQAPDIGAMIHGTSREAAFKRDGHLLSLSYAGGRDGMETTNRLLDALPSVLSSRGCAYVLLCEQNRPELVKRRLLEQYGPGWAAETVGTSGKTAGWEKLQIVRIWRISFKGGDES